MTRIRRAVLATALLGTAVVGAVALPSAALQPPIASEPLSGRAPFPDDVDVKRSTARSASW
jgi:hypothetical protein